ncbi:Hypothetical protein SRAE_2000393800 [Strongyloides ratti]|uniref:Uncharacterized protein n=1 Tax=Strongyloides ratti TaxID=34506 RepID=A0A090LM95_STRRB|nr:Hypothetical protein SRAE_2000393800 [Strongyloides ratti]CEF69288.1 Hypothetical protein SRAE_2000393800 [Strongyloides ratti]
MNIPSIDETIKRPTTAINNHKVNLNTRLRPLYNKSSFNKGSPEKDNTYYSAFAFQNALNNKSLTRYSTSRYPNISSDGEGIYPISSLEKVSLQQPYTDSTVSSDPVYMNVEGFSQNGRHLSVGGQKNSAIISSKPSTVGVQRKMTTKRNIGTSKKSKIMEIIHNKSKVTLKCFCILILLLIPIVIFIIMIIYSSSLELDRPRDLSKNIPK